MSERSAGQKTALPSCYHFDVLQDDVRVFFAISFDAAGDMAKEKVIAKKKRPARNDCV